MATKLSAKEWQKLNRKVHKKLKAGSGKLHTDARLFLKDLKRRIWKP